MERMSGVFLVWFISIQLLVSRGLLTEQSPEDDLKLIDELKRILHMDTDENESTEDGSFLEDDPTALVDKEEDGLAGRDLVLDAYENEVEEGYEDQKNLNTNQREKENDDDGPDPYKKEETDMLNPEIVQTNSEITTKKSQSHKGGKMIDDFMNRILNGENVDPNNPIVNQIESSDVHIDGGGFKVSVNNNDEIIKVAKHNDKNEGDVGDKHIDLSRNEAKEIESEDMEGNWMKRNFPGDTSYVRLWPNGTVPYEIRGSLQAPNNTAVIEEAVRQMNSLTCVKFVHRFSHEASNLVHNNYVAFASISGCWSYVGYIATQGQEISLGSRCVTVSTALHEMMHAIGQQHEQSRSDRNDYVDILWNNMKEGQSVRGNFDKEDTLDNNPYDHQSLLQYGLWAFSKNDNPTMEFHDRKLDFLADSSEGLTFYDVQDILDAYKCSDHCINPPKCQNAGVVNHKCQCYCPNDITGTLCERTTSDSVCGRDILDLSDGVPQTILSPKTSAGDAYPLNVKCVWLVRAPVGKRIKLTINELELTYSRAYKYTNGGWKQIQSCDHWLEVQYNLIGQSGPKECGIDIQRTFKTTGDGQPNMMMLKFDSVFAADKPAKRGFNLTVETIGLGCTTKPCKFGTCSEDAAGGYTCSCQTPWTGRNCDNPAATATFLCTFEEGNQCIMSNVNDDDFDWIVHTRKTASSGTGPDSAQEGLYYIYMEGSSPRVKGDIARFETAYNLPAIERCLTFWYHMYGSYVGSLSVYTSSSSNPIRQYIWSKSGNQPNTWYTVNIDIKAEGGLKIGFEAERGSSWSSDIAVDNIELRPGTCSQTWTYGPPTTKAPLTTTYKQTTTKTVPPVTQKPTTHLPYTTTSKPTTTQAPPTTTRKPTTTQAPPTTTRKPTTTQAPPTTTRKPTTTQTPPTTTRKPTTTQTPPTTTQAPPTTTIKPTTTTTTNSPTSKAITSIPNPPSTNSGNVLYFCNFEPADDKSCFLREVPYDDFDWTLKKGSTSTLNTGPYEAKEGKYYKYIETSRKNGKGSEAILESQILPKETDMCLQFYYHMYGKKTGSLTVRIEKLGSSNIYDEWTESGNLGNSWNYVELDLHKLSDQYLILFVAKQGRSRTGDIAIDDVKIRDGLCAPLALPAACTFEPGEHCFLRNYAYDFDWRINKGKTASAKTGPSGAVEGIYYKYIEGSSPNKMGNEAWLGSNQLPAGIAMCLRFQYHMYGNGIGKLIVEHEVDGVFRSLWSLDHDNGDQWFQVGVDLPPYDKPSRIYFVGERGKSFRGDIAIDDIHVDKGACPRHPSAGFHCSFSPNEFPCFLNNVDYDQFDWSFSNGRTPSSGTGPSSPYDGHYGYIEASSPRKYGDIAILSSEHTTVPEGHLCLQFMYNMNGKRINSLEVYSGQYKHEEMRWSIIGNQGDKWTLARVNIPAVSRNQTIVIAGVRGKNFRGDIAIDDVWLYQDFCN